MSGKRLKKVVSVEEQKDHSLIFTYEDNSQVAKLTDGTILKICPMCGERNDVNQKVCQGNIANDGGTKKYFCGTILDAYIYDGGWTDYGTKSNRPVT